MTASCPGFASYTNLTTGEVSVGGRIPVFTTQQRIGPLVEAWSEYGSALQAAAARQGIPVAWLVGIMMTESKGEQYACSPCDLCGPSFCEEGAGMRCCAFGLMQFIGATARRYGTTPSEIMQNPYRAISVAAELVSDLGASVGFDLVRIAAAYNGGIGKCGKAGTTFGWNTNGDYPYTVVQYANTFVGLKLPVPVNASRMGVVLSLLGIGTAVAIYTGKIRWR